MSTDSTLRPIQQLLPPVPRPGLTGSGRGTTRGGGGRSSVAIRLPATAQLLVARTAQSLAIGQTRRRWLLLAVTAGLFAVIVSREIAFALEMWVSKTIAGIPQHYLLTALVALFAIINDGKYLQRLLSRPIVVFYLFCLLMVVAVGVFRNGHNTFIVRADLYAIRWFFVGFMLMRLAIISGSLKEYLVATTISILVTSLNISDRNTLGGQLDSTMTRATSSDFWPVINLGLIMLGLLVTVNWPRGIPHVAFSATAFSLLILVGGIKTSTRSLFIAQTVCFLLCLLALSRDPRMRGRGRELQKAGLVVLLLAACLITYLVVTGGILSSMTQLGARFAEESFDRKSTGSARLNEATEFLETMTTEEWLFGMGAGGMWFSARYNQWCGVPHIAVLGWLMKGGLFIFAVVVWTLYIRPLAAFVKAALVPRRDVPLPPPILIVGPPLVAWTILTFMSGGIDIGSFLGLGGLSALWLQLADEERQFVAAQKKTPTSAPC